MKKALIALFLFPLTFAAQKNLEKESSVDLITQGFEHHSKEQYYEAIQKYKKVSVNDTNYVLAQYETALSYIAQGEYVFAQKILKNLLKYEVPYDSKASVYKMLAQTYEGEKKFDEAMKTYDEAIRLYPKNHNLYFSRGLTLEKFEKHQEALESYKQAVKCYMHHASSHLRLGLLAAGEGQYVQSYLSLMTFVLLEPNTDRTAQVIKLMDEMANGSYSPEAKGLVLSQEGDDFEDLNLFFKNQVALQDKYKAKFTYSTSYAKQFHLILSNAKYDENDKGFWTQQYLPFYLDIFKENQLDNMILFSLKSIDNAKIQKKINAKKASLNTFIDQLSDKWANFISKQILDYEGSSQEVYAIYQTSGFIMGKQDEEGKIHGNWYYYTPEGNLRLVAVYEHGKKQGSWVWRDYFTQTVSEVTEFKDDMKDGSSKLYYPSGELREMTTYVKGKVKDTVYTYYRNGQISEKIAVANEMRNGLNTAYYENGAVRFRVGYKDNKGEGRYESFYPNGQLQVEMTLVNDKVSGVRKSYHVNGQQESEYTYNEKGPQGAFTEWYANGQVEEKGEMKDGNYIGEITSFYSNGLPFSKGRYDESGKENGSIEYYDSYGVKYQEFTYKKGDLQQIRNFNEKGELVKTIDKNGKKMKFESLNPTTRALRVSGTFENEKRSGIWEYYDEYGNLKNIEKYVNGLIQDTVKTYYSNGKLESSCMYKDNLKDGLYLEYNKYGELIVEGMFKDDYRSNDWYEYYPDGSLKVEYSYKDGKMHGYQKTYSVSGKLEEYDIFDQGEIIASVYLDTMGIEIQRFGEYNGLVSIKSPANTFNIFVADYKNGNLDGKAEWFDEEDQLLTRGYYLNSAREGQWKWFFPDGKVRKITEYKNGQVNGKMLEYYENGQLYSEAPYLNDELNGNLKYYYENGKLDFQANYVDDLRHGKVISYSPSGDIQQIRYYDRGVLLSYSYLDKSGKEVPPVKIGLGTSTFTTYYKSGTKALEQTRVNGELNGKYVKYLPNEKIIEQEDYYFGDRHGSVIEYYENGNKKLENTYKWDLRHGLETSYHPNGKIAYTLDFVFGKRHGVKKEYDSNGKLIKTIYFYNDDVIKVVKS